MENKIKKKLKRRGEDVYLKYFANPNDIISMVIENLDANKPIDNSLCEIVFDVPISFKEKIYELLLFYPIKLKEISYINENVVNNLYIEYGETIDIMKGEIRTNKKYNPRGKICSNASNNSKKNNCYFKLISEDIKLVKICPILEIPLKYDNNKALDNSASIDKINPMLGYNKDNIQIISLLANKMKSNATPEQLVMFAKKILKIYS
jgi:hypothetical protein